VDCTAGDSLKSLALQSSNELRIRTFAMVFHGIGQRYGEGAVRPNKTQSRGSALSHSIVSINRGCIRWYRFFSSLAASPARSMTIYSRSTRRTMSNGSINWAKTGRFSTSALMRASNFTVPTTPTLRPKLRKVRAKKRAQPQRRSSRFRPRAVRVTCLSRKAP
jgi:hypothetical protein